LLKLQLYGRLNWNVRQVSQHTSEVRTSTINEYGTFKHSIPQLIAHRNADCAECTTSIFLGVHTPIVKARVLQPYCDKSMVTHCTVLTEREYFLSLLQSIIYTLLLWIYFHVDRYPDHLPPLVDTELFAWLNPAAFPSFLTSCSSKMSLLISSCPVLSKLPVLFQIFTPTGQRKLV